MKDSLSIGGIVALAVCVLALAALGGANSARAATFSVRNLNDNGPGSLRQTIAVAAAGDTIVFGVTGTISLASGALTITQDLDIEGPGANKLKISGGHVSRVFVIQTGKVTLAGITITGGLADASSPTPASTGGGVLNYGALTLLNDVVSDNQALGDASVSPSGIPGLSAAGAIASFGILNVTTSQFTGNLARGGDGGRGASAGQAVGGAIGNFGSATIINSQFTGNLARGGDSESGTFDVGAAFGGAIGNAGALAITAGTFSHNQAVGGNGNPGPNSGAGFGGAIFSGSAGAFNAALDVTGSKFDHNNAIGGNNGNLAGVAGSSASGGAIYNAAAPATLTASTLGHNEALGGAGGLGANGGDGFGGGLAAANTESSLTIANCTFEHNTALGGPGGAGGNGGAGQGGGLNGNFGATLAVSGTTVFHNLAQGGDGGSGGNGGNGLGGGLLDDSASTLTLTDAIVTYNQALGGAGGLGANGGEGVGGGVYSLGTFSFDSATIIRKNHASTSNDNLFP